MYDLLYVKSFGPYFGPYVNGAEGQIAAHNRNPSQLQAKMSYRCHDPDGVFS